MTVQCVKVQITAAQGSEHFLGIILHLIHSVSWTMKCFGIAQNSTEAVICEGDYTGIAVGKIV